MQKSESIANLAAALCACQAELSHANKNSRNPHFKSDYADLAEVIATVKAAACKHGLSFSQMPGIDKHGNVTVETLLVHQSGEFISSVSASPAQKSTPQGIGSAITYLRRYSLAAVFGIAQADDDGNAASQPATQQPATWPDDKFKEQLPAIIDAIQSGRRTAADAIAFLQSKGDLTEAQIAQINSIQ